MRGDFLNKYFKVLEKMRKTNLETGKIVTELLTIEFFYLKTCKIYFSENI